MWMQYKKTDTASSTYHLLDTDMLTIHANIVLQRESPAPWRPCSGVRIPARSRQRRRPPPRSKHALPLPWHERRPAWAWCGGPRTPGLPATEKTAPPTWTPIRGQILWTWWGSRRVPASLPPGEARHKEWRRKQRGTRQARCCADVDNQGRQPMRERRSKTNKATTTLPVIRGSSDMDDCTQLHPSTNCMPKSAIKVEEGSNKRQPRELAKCRHRTNCALQTTASNTVHRSAIPQ